MATCRKQFIIVNIKNHKQWYYLSTLPQQQCAGQVINFLGLEKFNSKWHNFPALHKAEVYLTLWRLPVPSNKEYRPLWTVCSVPLITGHRIQNQLHTHTASKQWIDSGWLFSMSIIYLYSTESCSISTALSVPSNEEVHLKQLPEIAAAESRVSETV